MDDLQHFDTWCFCEIGEDPHAIGPKVERRFKEIRETCETRKVHPLSISTHFSVGDGIFSCLIIVQTVSIDFLQRQQLQQSLSPNPNGQFPRRV